MYAVTVHLSILHEQWCTIDRGLALNIPRPPNNFIIYSLEMNKFYVFCMLLSLAMAGASWYSQLCSGNIQSNRLLLIVNYLLASTCFSCAKMKITGQTTNTGNRKMCAWLLEGNRCCKKFKRDIIHF